MFTNWMRQTMARTKVQIWAQTQKTTEPKTSREK